MLQTKDQQKADLSADISGSAHPEDTHNFIPPLISPVCSDTQIYIRVHTLSSRQSSFVPRKLVSASLWLIGLPSCSRWFSYTQINMHPCALGTESLTHSRITIQRSDSGLQARASTLPPSYTLFFFFFFSFERSELSRLDLNLPILLLQFLE